MSVEIIDASTATGSPTPPPSRAPLRREGRFIYAGAEPFDWREASAFTLLKRVINGEDIRPTLRAFRAEGITILRVLLALGHPGWDSWRHTPQTPGYDPALRTLAELALAEDLRLRCTRVPDLYYTCAHDFGTATVIAAQYLEQQNAVLDDFPAHCDEITNEPAGTGESGHGWPTGDPSSQALLAQLLPTRFVALGAEHGARGHLPTYDVEPADYVTAHVERRIEFNGWNWLKRLMGDYGVVATGVRPVVSGEPINAGDQGKPGDFVPNPGIWYAYGVGSRLADSHGYAPCFHFNDGLYARFPTGRTLECLRAFIQGCRDVPLSVRPLPFVNGHWSSSPWRGYTQTENPPQDDRPFRIFGKGGPGTYWGIALRHRPGWSWSDLRYPVHRVREVSDGEWAASLWRA